MKVNVIVLFFLLISQVGFGQQTYQRKKSRSDFYGEKRMAKNKEQRDDKVRPFGLQVQLGATASFPKSDKKNETVPFTDNTLNYSYMHDPQAKPGIYAEIGFVHFNIRPKENRNARIYDYLDYGIGVKTFRGSEMTTINRFNVANEIDQTSVGTGNLMNGNVFARFGLHKFIYLTKKKKLFLDNSLGINVDYRLFGGNMDYKGAFLPTTQAFSKELVLNLHYSLGLGIRIAKGKYIMPQVSLPLLGVFDGFGATPKYHWFSSKYYPVTFTVKYIHLFPAKKNKHACWTGDPEDRKRNEQYMQSQ